MSKRIAPAFIKDFQSLTEFDALPDLSDKHFRSFLSDQASVVFDKRYHANKKFGVVKHFFSGSPAHFSKRYVSLVSQAPPLSSYPLMSVYALVDSEWIPVSEREVRTRSSKLLRNQ